MAERTRTQPPATSVGDLPTHTDAAPAATAAFVPPAAGFNYELGEELGRGGMGVVYRARQKGLNRPAAVKMVLGGERAGPKDLIRFLAEAEAVASVQSPHVVRVYDYGEADGRPYLAMEYCDGGTLADRLRAGKLAPADAADLLAAVADGVAAIHAAGIVHRDLKPGNVLFDAAGTPKVTDFGLAKRGAGADLTRTEAVMGTPAYMSPEQAKGQAKFVGPPADVWALGVMLYEAVAGVRPFAGGDPWELLQAVAAAEPTGLRAAAPGTPRDMHLICHKCLAKEPHERYATAAELAADLRAWRAGRPVAARPLGAARRAAKWVRRNKRVAGAAAAVFLALAGGAGVATWQWWRAEQTYAELVKQQAEVQEALGREAAERERVTAALDRERQAVGRLQTSLVGRAADLGRRADGASARDWLGLARETEELKAVWSELIGITRPVSDAQQAEFRYHIGCLTLRQSWHCERHLAASLRQSAKLELLASFRLMQSFALLESEVEWKRMYSSCASFLIYCTDNNKIRNDDNKSSLYRISAQSSSVDGPPDLGLAAVAGPMVTTAAARPNIWTPLATVGGVAAGWSHQMVRWPLDYGMPLAALTGTAAALAVDDHVQSNALREMSLTALREVANHTHARTDRLALADALKDCSFETYYHGWLWRPLAFSWADAELTELIKLADTGDASDWCKLVSLHCRLAQLTADSDPGKAELSLAAAENALAEAVRRFGQGPAKFAISEVANATINVALAAGNHQRAAAAVRRSEPLSAWDGTRLAGCLIRCVRAARSDTTLSNADRQVYIINYTTQTMTILRGAIKLDPIEVHKKLRCSVFDSIRDTPEYIQIIDEIMSSPVMKQKEVEFRHLMERAKTILTPTELAPPPRPAG